MGGRFGKYGDLKRLKALQRGRREKSKLERANLIARRSRNGLPLPKQGFSFSDSAKSYKTAVVAIPPENIWEPIQDLREQYDRHYRRWMPHITLIYPFLPASAFDQALPLMARVCRSLKPFELRLNRFDIFVRSRRTATLYLVPEPGGAIKALQKKLLEIVPKYDSVNRFAGGFTPHLTVGQTRSRKAGMLCAGWQATWQPLAFTLAHIYLIWRNDPPDDIFCVGAELSLG